MVEDFVKCFSHMIFKKFAKAEMSAKKVTVKLRYRDPSHGFEPAKYGGCGYFVPMNKSIDKLPSKLTEEFLYENMLETLKYFEIPHYEWRGLGLHIEVAPPVDANEHNNTKQNFFKNKIPATDDLKNDVLNVSQNACDKIKFYIPKYGNSGCLEVVKLLECFIRNIIIRERIEARIFIFFLTITQESYNIVQIHEFDPRIRCKTLTAKYFF